MGGSFFNGDDSSTVIGCGHSLGAVSPDISGRRGLLPYPSGHNITFASLPGLLLTLLMFIYMNTSMDGP